ncbi:MULTISPECIES: hypothetical protein [unclassified Spirosoma]|uniref:hypothetical protein n=1 Tax=unclassified Spirosoma TaxID=2621999 RepID=UPI000960AB13|nr:MULTISPECIES: hypothetical protein [unclassified Spirosoma]MBN8824447.1 hypothetical protein [Spirosoma sp.]OJW70090.1 MAG: hypothetical protein BGO59_25790 [Spirosoma sp. 48-14]
MNLATITAGAYHGSGFVTVACNQANGTAILVYRGTSLLGQGVLSAGSVVIAVPALATNDIIQASVTERGNAAGAPVVVTASANPPTGWQTPDTVAVTRPNGSTEIIAASAYEAEFGVKPAASYDPRLKVSVVGPDPETIQQIVSTPILFSVLIDKQVAQTVVTVSNVTGQNGTPLVRWASSEAFGNSLSRTFTAAATVTIDVKGDSDTAFVSQTISVTVFSPSTSTPSASDIIALAYSRGSGTDIIRGIVNAGKACQCKLEPFTSTWQAMEFHDFDCQDVGFYPVPAGTYTLYARVSGDTNSANWRSLTVVKP